MKALIGAFNQEKALVEAFSVIVKSVVEPMDRFTALISTPNSFINRPLVHFTSANHGRGADEGQVTIISARAANGTNFPRYK